MPSEEGALAGHVAHVHRAGAGSPRPARPATRPLARTALASEPNASRSPARAYTSGLTPSGSRTTKSVPAPPVEEREREDPVESVGEADALVLVEVGEELGVAGRVQLVAARQHELAQLGVVVDLAVVDDDHRTVFVRHRLEPPARPGSPGAGCRGTRRRRRRSPRRRVHGGRSCRSSPAERSRHRIRRCLRSRTRQAPRRPSRRLAERGSRSSRPSTA